MLDMCDFKCYIFIGISIVTIFLIYKYGNMSRLLMKLGYQLYIRTSFGPWYFRREIKRAAEKYIVGTHSSPHTISYGFINITIMPYALTNYGFIIWTEKSNQCIIIDPGDSAPFKSYFSNHEITPGLILLTHKHHDHSYGVKDLHYLYPDAEIVCSAVDHIHFASNEITLNQTTFTFNFNSSNKLIPETKNVKIHALLVPGHTMGSVIYWLDLTDTEFMKSNGDNNYGLYFTGDTVFTGSIGKMFESDASTYFYSIRRFIESILQHSCPIGNILIFPAHEYGVDNLEFINVKLNQFDDVVVNKLSWCQSKRVLCEPTIPSSILEEFSYNPFLRLVLSNDNILKEALSKKFEVILDIPKIEELIKDFFSLTVSKSLLKCNTELLSVKAFKKVRRLRDL